MTRFLRYVAAVLCTVLACVLIGVALPCLWFGWRESEWRVFEIGGWSLTCALAFAVFAYLTMPEED